MMVREMRSVIIRIFDDSTTNVCKYSIVVIADGDLRLEWSSVIVRLQFTKKGINYGEVQFDSYLIDCLTRYSVQQGGS